MWADKWIKIKNMSVVIILKFIAARWSDTNLKIAQLILRKQNKQFASK